MRLLPGWTLLEQIFICSNGAVYCDNYPGSGNNYLDLSAIAPGNPFTITEVFHIVSDGVDQAHLAGAIVVDPQAPCLCLDRSPVPDFPV